jgi:hypothetical protein
VLIECDVSRTGLEPLIATKYIMIVVRLESPDSSSIFSLELAEFNIIVHICRGASHVESLASMKRTEALVSYSSSDDSDTESQPAPPLKKKYANSPYTAT